MSEKSWIPRLREEVDRWGNFYAMPDDIYRKYLDDSEWLMRLNEFDLSIFILLVCEAES